MSWHRLIIQYLINKYANQLIIFCRLRFFYVFRLLQGQHQGGMYKGVQYSKFVKDLRV